MHLVGFIIEICYDTRSYKRQICRCSFVNPKSIYMQLSYRPGESHLLYTQQHKCTLIKVTALFRGRQSNSLNFYSCVVLKLSTLILQPQLTL